MDTNKKSIWKMPKNPVYTALSWFVVGSFLGFIVGHRPMMPMSCHAPMLRAHFLERQLAFETSPLSDRSSSSSVSLRGAATDEPIVSSEAVSAPSVVALPIVPASSSVQPIVEAQIVPTPASSAESASSSASAVSESASASSSSTSSVSSDFPAFDHAVYPIGRVPNWGAMKTPGEWERDYDEMKRDDFVRIPLYDMDDLTTPMSTLLKDRDDPETIRILTAKLFYSTRFFGSYNLDAGEFSGEHAGIDLKLPKGTPVGAIAGGRVSGVIREESGLGLHVIIEHRVGDETFYSIYGHLSAVSVTDGQDVAPGTTIGAVGGTGRSTAPHLHLQVDRGSPDEAHTAYWPGSTPTRTEAGRHTINPFSFIANHSL